jgi:hypothetical protein
MSKFKFLTISVVFAITYIACDLFFIFYIADKTDANTTTFNHSTSYEPVSNFQQQAYAYNAKPNLKVKQSATGNNATIVE